MSDQEPKIKISDPNIEIYDPNKDVAQKFDFYIKIVIGIFVVTTVVLIVMVGTFIIDSFHINSATYEQYSVKKEEQIILLETNKTLLEQIKKDQEVIKWFIDNYKK